MCYLSIFRAERANKDKAAIILAQAWRRKPRQIFGDSPEGAPGMV